MFYNYRGQKSDFYNQFHYVYDGFPILYEQYSDIIILQA